MAVSSTAAIEVRTTGDDGNGALYNSAGSNPGVDYSQQNAPQYIVNDITANGTTTLTSASGNFAPDLNRNGITINGLPYEIVARTSASQIVVDRTVATGSNLVGRVGGAAASVGQVAAWSIASNALSNGVKCWTRYGIYTMSGTYNVPGGNVNLTGAGVRFEGYDSVRGDRARKPVFNSLAGSISLFTVAAAVGVAQFANLRANANGFANLTAFNAGTRSNLTECEAIGCSVGIASRGFRCYAENCGTGYQSGSQLCVSVNCTTGYQNGSHAMSIAIGGTRGFVGPSGGSLNLLNCLTWGTTSEGIFTQNAGAYIQNCIVASSGGTGYSDSTVQNAVIDRFAVWGNGSVSPYATHVLSANPFLSSGATITSWADAFAAFALNNDPGGGALLRGAGFPAFFDIGPIQHQDSGGGGGGTGSAGSIFGSSIISRGGRTI